MAGTHRLLATSALLLAADLSAAPLPRQPDPERLQGTWRFVSCEVDGEKTPPERLRAGGKAEFVFEKDRFRVTDGKNRRAGTFRLEPGGGSGRIDLTDTTDPDEHDPSPQLGIYKFEGDHLVICLSGGKDRPTAFESKRGSANNVLLRLARKKAE
jgi:uncharacterized protein (TIGR03067 family)